MSQLTEEEGIHLMDLAKIIVDHRMLEAKVGANYCPLGTYQDFCTFRKTIFVELEEHFKDVWGESVKGFEYRKIKGEDVLCFCYTVPDRKPSK